MVKRRMFNKRAVVIPFGWQLHAREAVITSIFLRWATKHNRIRAGNHCERAVAFTNNNEAYPSIVTSEGEAGASRAIYSTR